MIRQVLKISHSQEDVLFGNSFSIGLCLPDRISASDTITLTLHKPGVSFQSIDRLWPTPSWNGRLTRDSPLEKHIFLTSPDFFPHTGQRQEGVPHPVDRKKSTLKQISTGFFTKIHMSSIHAMSFTKYGSQVIFFFWDHYNPRGISNNPISGFNFLTRTDNICIYLS